jgi:hypothetical protein
MENQEKVFADGLIAKRRDNAPEYVIVNLSVKVDEFIAFLRNNERNGWVNLGVKRGRTGNLYTELDTFNPKKEEEVANHPPKQHRTAEEKARPMLEQESSFNNEDDDDLPF